MSYIMRLILTRHGETIENKKGIFQGEISGTLSRLGKQQAKKLALRLKNEKIDVIYSSDLKRALDTTKTIAKYHKKTLLIIDRQLRERYCGKLEGKKIPENFDWETISNGLESRKSIAKRAKSFVDKILKKHKNQTVLVVSHGGVQNAFLTLLHKQAGSEFSDFKGVTNTSVSMIDVNENRKHKIHYVNCTKHLD